MPERGGTSAPWSCNDTKLLVQVFQQGPRLRPPVRLLDEVVEHPLGHFEVCDHAIFQGLDRLEIAAPTAQHLLGFLADRLDFAGAIIKSSRGGLVDHDALVPDINTRVNRTQVDRES